MKMEVSDMQKDDTKFNTRAIRKEEFFCTCLLMEAAYKQESFCVRLHFPLLFSAETQPTRTWRSKIPSNSSGTKAESF